MPIYKISNKSVRRYQIKDNGFGDEFSLRDLFAANLEELLGIRFVAKEYPTVDGRIDTLGLDENNSPVIIEYKWKENEEVLSQGLFYFNWLIKNKKHFELLIEKVLGKEINVNWDQPRVILIAQGFGRYIVGAVQQEKYVELVTYSYYEPDILHLEYLFTPQEGRSIHRENNKETERHYSIDFHLENTSQEIKKIFNQIRSKVLELPEVEEKANQKSGITYRTTKSFVRFEFKQSWIQVLLRDPKYETDTKRLVKDVTSNEWGYRGIVKITTDSDPDYIYGLIKESYESTL